MSKRLSAGVYDELAEMLGCDVAAVRAVTYVESGRDGFDNQGRPKILYEPHIAYRQARGTARARLVSAGLAWKGWRPGRYPRSSEARYIQVRRCAEIAGDDVAYGAISMGFPQILGTNHKRAGYDSAKAMWDAFNADADEHLRAMARFIKADSTMLNALRAHNWATFARRYNGAGYRKNRYDIKLASAHSRFASGSRPSGPVNSKWLDQGDKGAAVEDLQTKLSAAGHDLQIDGDFGKATEAAVMAFQKSKGLKVDGIAGPATMRALEAPDVAKQNPEPLGKTEQPTNWLAALINAILNLFRR